jgi:superfamily II DNA or RNA helicase
MALIDNKTVVLLDELRNALSSAEAIDIYTGYFFFSGFGELSELIKDKKIRVVVGMDLDPLLIKAKRLTDDTDLTRLRLAEAPLTDSAKVKNYIDSFIALFENSDVFDNDRMTGAIETFFEKIKDGSLEIKMNLEIQHGKFYLIHNKPEFSQGGSFPGTRFMGSSNFSLAGLKNQGEINDSSREKEEYTKYKQIFDDTWANAKSVPVLDKYLAPNFAKTIKKSTSLFIDPEPYTAFLRILKQEFHQEDDDAVNLPKELSDGIFSNLAYQSDAVKDALEKLRLYNGVILADVVGLGKSIIASAIAANTGKRAILIVPPHLEQMWKEYSYTFKFPSMIYSSGKIEKALDDNGYAGEQIVIVDEAHRYRNEDTLDYQNLHKLCVNKQVILLTATPFNNDPKDVFALIKLFDPPSQSRINTVENLSQEFRSLISQYSAMRRGLRKMNEKDVEAKATAIAEKMRKMIEPVIIRRSRIDLDKIDRYRIDLKSQGYEFSEVLPPKLQEYDLGKLRDLYFSTLERITDPEKGFTAARYQPSNYVSDEDKLLEIIKTYYGNNEDFKQAQANLASFMRRFLVLRFESSVAAFKSTLENFINNHELILDWWKKFGYIPIYKKGKIPDPAELELSENLKGVSDDFSESELKELLGHAKLSGDVKKGLMLLPNAIIKQSFETDLVRDIEMLKKLRDQWDIQAKDFDPKCDDLKVMVEDLRGDDPNRKLVIFTAYADTASYLHKKLSENHKCFMYSGEVASQENKNIVVKNFDAGLPKEKRSNDYDILVATDAISEGYNLHRAGVIINYDIPYNPVRVIQRIGRINRINKKVFDKLHIINCFPSAIGEDEVQTKKISKLKVHLMNVLIGSDTQILTSEEQLESFFVDRVEIEKRKEEKESWDTRYINIWDKVRYDHELMKKVDDLKQRSFLARRSSGPKGLVLFGQKGEGIPTYVIANNSGEASRIGVEDALPVFECDLDEKNESRTKKFGSNYENAKERLFQPTTMADKKGRRGEAISVLEFLAEQWPEARTHCSDAKNIISDLDGFPEGTLKRMIDLGPNYLKSSDYVNAYAELQLIASVEYMEALRSRVAGLASEKETLLIAEELL